MSTGNDESHASAESARITAARIAAPGSQSDAMDDWDPTPSMLARARRGLDLLRQLLPDSGDELEDVAANAVDASLQDEFDAEGCDLLFDRYEIVRTLGCGGHGTVFLARDLQLERHVAIKMPHPEVLFSEGLRRRFIAESHAVAEFNHPGILPVYDSGHTDGDWYIVMAYCDGPTLAQWLRDQSTAVDTKLAAQIVLSLSRAAHYAHMHGRLHRDIKPSNVLLMPVKNSSSDSFPYEPKLADFGLSKNLKVSDESTLPGAPMGTRQYMAPEQWAGRPEEVGVQTDVYALGVVLYELLTGRPPFADVGAADWLRVVTEQPPTALRSLRRDVPPDLAAICHKCLEKRPADRYPDAEALAEDLWRFQDGRPVIARTIPMITRAARWCRRRPLVASLVSSLLISIICGVWGIVWQWREAVANLNEARAHETLARRRLDQAQDLLVRLSWAVDESFFWNDSGYKFAFEFRPELQQEVERFVKEQPHLSPSLLATTQWRAAYRDYEAGQRDAAEAACRKSLQGWRQLVHEQPRNPQFRRSLALVLYYHTIYRISFGDNADALIDLSNRPGLEGFSYANETDVQIAAEFADMLIQRARALDKASHTMSAANTYKLAALACMYVAAAEPTNPEHRFLAAENYRCMGAALERVRRPDESRIAYGVAERVLPGTGGGNAFRNRCNIKLAEILSALGRVRVELGRTQEGLKTLEAAAKLWLEVTIANAKEFSHKQRAAEAAWQLASYRLRHEPSNEQTADWQRCRILHEDLRADKTLGDDELVRLADANYHLAKHRISASDAVGAISLLREATECYGAIQLDRRSSQHVLGHAECWLLLGDQQRALGQSGEAQAAYRESRKLVEHALAGRVLESARQHLRALDARTIEAPARARNI